MNESLPTDTISMHQRIADLEETVARLTRQLSETSARLEHSERENERLRRTLEQTRNDHIETQQTLHECQAVLRANQARLQAIFDNAMVGIVIGDSQGRYTLVNQGVTDTVGYTPEELYRVHPASLLHPDDRDAALAEMQAVLRGQIEAYQTERRYIHKNGSIIWAYVSARAIRNEDNHVESIIGVIIDITKLKQMQDQLHVMNVELEQRVIRRTDQIEATNNALRASEQRFRAIFEWAGLGIVLGDGTGRIVESNPAFQHFLGYTSDELRGMHYTKFSHPDDLPAENALVTELLTNKRESYEYEKRYIRKDGTIVWGQVTTSLIRDTPERADFGISLVTDLTERKQMEALLVEKERYATMQHMTGIVAHEVNTPLQLILGILEWLPGIEQAQQRTFLDMAKEEIQRIGTILHQLMDTYQPSSEVRTKVHIPALVERVLLLMSGRLAKLFIQVERSIDDNLPLIDGVIGELTQVLINLVLNAIEAMPDGGTLSVRVQQTEAASIAQIREGHLSPSFIYIDICDTGIGISPDDHANIFDPFCTSKQTGTGLGLFVCKRIIDNHEGAILVRSTPGEGSQFTIVLPVTHEEL